MTPLPHTPDLLALAPSIIWFEAPEKALADPYRFMAYLMTYGTADDIATMRRHLPASAFTEALAHAPAGIMDARSWAYWNVMAGHDTPPQRPQRF